MWSPSPAPLLQTKNVTKRFGELVAVHKVDLTVGGEFVIIIGPNGAGKTTLFDLITRRQNPSAGKSVFRE